MTDQLPELPYGGPVPNSGWSGSSSSRDRALGEDADGTTTKRQRSTLAAIGNTREYGMTWKELAFQMDWHHGQASGTLSNLHGTGHLARLTERRNRCQVYVLPEFVDGRETAAHGRKQREPVSADERVTAVLDVWLRRDRWGRCKADGRPLGFTDAIKAAYYGEDPPTDDGTLFPT